MKKKLRQIVVDGNLYLWKFAPGYTRIDDMWICYDLFVAYLQSAPASPLRVHFHTWEDSVVGWPLRIGAALNEDGSGMGGINLHTPA